MAVRDLIEAPGPIDGDHQLVQRGRNRNTAQNGQTIQGQSDRRRRLVLTWTAKEYVTVFGSQRKFSAMDVRSNVLGCFNRTVIFQIKYPSLASRDRKEGRSEGL